MGASAGALPAVLLGTGTAPLAMGALMVGRVLTLLGPFRRDDIAAELGRTTRELFVAFDSWLCVGLPWEDSKKMKSVTSKFGFGGMRDGEARRYWETGPGNATGVPLLQGGPYPLPGRLAGAGKIVG